MGKLFPAGMNRRRFIGLTSVAGLAYGVLPPKLQAWSMGGYYTRDALARVNAHLPFHFDIEEQFDRPVINARTATPGWSFEGCTAVKVAGLYRLFSNQYTLAHLGSGGSTRLTYWISHDGKQWQRKPMIISPTVPGAKGFATTPPWEATPVFDHRANCWYLFSVGYRGGDKIRLMVAKKQGYQQGIDGPWQQVSGTIMRPGADSQSWEGVQGVDSFCPYQVHGRWYAMYGSSNWSPINPHPRWEIGLASAPALRGPWKRCAGNPLQVEKVFWENPIVSRIGDWYVAVYDAVAPGAPTYMYNGGHIAGYTCSKDGIHWLPGGRILVQPNGPANWSSDLRTPTGLIPEGNGIYTMFYAAFEKGRHKRNPWLNYESIGMVRLRIVWHR